MGREGKARKIRGGDTHIVMSMTSMALNTKGDSSIGLFQSVIFCDIQVIHSDFAVPGP